MGVKEELEALRKQGVTKKKADELKDAEGLSTPEAAENAMKAQQERTRLANYGKEASEFLRAAGSPGKKEAMLKVSKDDDGESVPEITEAEVPAGKQSKDLTKLIQITNDFAFVEEAVEEKSDDEGLDPIDCFYKTPTFCPIDSNAVDGATRSVKGALDEHVLPKLEGASKSVKNALGEHLIPRVEKIHRQSIETANNFQQKSMGTVGSIQQKSMETVGSIQQKSLDTIEAARNNSIRTIGSMQGETHRIFGRVQKNSSLLMQYSATAVNNVSAKTMQVVNGEVKPRYHQLVESARAACYDLAEDITVTYAPYYMGTAAGWVSLTTNSSVSWYWLLKEASLRAFGRVVFCDNPVTGFFIWLGILCCSPLAACCSWLGVLTANATAMYLELDEEIIRSGQYARNAVLIGTSIAESFEFDFPANGHLDSGVTIYLFLSIALAPVTVIAEYIWIKNAHNGMPSLLLPFNIVFLITVFCAKIWNLAMVTQVRFNSPVPARISVDEIDTEFSSYEAVLNGLSRIFFVGGNNFSGILILIGVFFCSRIITSSLLVGSYVSSVLLGYIVFKENYWYLDSGHAGFNPALCTAGIFFYLVPSEKLMGLAVFVIAVTMIVQGAVDVVLGILGTHVSTSLGFCLTLFPLLTTDFGSIFGNRENYFIRTVPKSELSTPEDYLKRIGPSPPVPTDSNVSDDDDGTEAAIETTVNDSGEDPEAPSVNEGTPLLTS